MAQRLRALTVAQERFCLQYVAGPDEMRGNGTRCYLDSYPATTNEKAAGSSASRLLKRVNVLARMKELRDTAEEESRARLRSWVSMAPKAQEVLDRGMEGEWPKGWSDEQIRTALKSAQEVLDRALGNARHMHGENSSGRTINVFIAATASTDQQPVAVGLAYSESG